MSSSSSLLCNWDFRVINSVHCSAEGPGWLPQVFQPVMPMNPKLPPWPQAIDNLVQMFCEFLEESFASHAQCKGRDGAFPTDLWKMNLEWKQNSFSILLQPKGPCLSRRKKMLNWFRKGDIFIEKETFTYLLAPIIHIQLIVTALVPGGWIITEWFILELC